MLERFPNEQNSTEIVETTCAGRIVIISKKELLDKSAEFGSLECFRYILLNFGEIDKDTLLNAFFGGNKEIIQMCLDKLGKLKQEDVCSAICRAIQGFKQNIFEWIVEEHCSRQFRRVLSVIIVYY